MGPVSINHRVNLVACLDITGLIVYLLGEDHACISTYEEISFKRI